MSAMQKEPIGKVLELAGELLAVAEEGEVSSQDSGCAVLYGIVRDCAYRMKLEAERESALHRRQQWGSGRVEVS